MSQILSPKKTKTKVCKSKTKLARQCIGKQAIRELWKKQKISLKRMDVINHKDHISVSRLLEGSNYSLECVVCLQLLVHPVALSCGHYFCMSCIQKTQSQFGSLCPYCRHPVLEQYHEVDPNLKLILSHAQQNTLSQSQMTEYNFRLQKFESETSGRGLRGLQLQKGLRIKVRIKGHDQEAIVKKVILNRAVEVQMAKTKRKHVIGVSSLNICRYQPQPQNYFQERRINHLNFVDLLDNQIDNLLNPNQQFVQPQQRQDFYDVSNFLQLEPGLDIWNLVEIPVARPRQPQGIQID